METEQDLNAKILSLTALIREKHPELLKYLEEMPITIPDKKDPQINLAALRDYYNSLSTLLKKHLQETQHAQK